MLLQERAQRLRHVRGNAIPGHHPAERLPIVGDLAHEEKGRVLEESLQGVDALAHEGQHLGQVGVGEGASAQAADELVRGEAAEVAPVQPGQLLQVEHGPPQGDALELERLHELREGELVAPLRHGEAHQGEEVEHGLG